jgi:hypothetical protein
MQNTKLPVPILTVVKNIVKKKGSKYVASYCNVAKGTVDRWIKLKKVPPHYTFDIYKLANIPIDYSKFSFKDKDQFFTHPDTAKYCVEVFKKVLKKYDTNTEPFNIIEPSAGSGNFLPYLDNFIAMDIEPRHPDVKQNNFLDWTPTQQTNNNKWVAIGNPPFGLRGQLALKFVNHAATFCDYVAFILPQLFESDGKGVPRKRVKGLNLIHSEKIKSNFLYPHGKEVIVECIFQIWSKNHSNPKYTIVEPNEDIIKIYSLSDGGTPSSTRNKNMLNKCDIYLPSTCFGKENMKFYTNFLDLPGQKGYGIVFKQNKQENLEKFTNTDWPSVAFLSTNSAYNIRTSQIAELFQ